MVAQRHIDTNIHLKKCVTKIARTPGAPGTKSYAQIINNYQLLTLQRLIFGATKTCISGVTGKVDALLNLTVIKKKCNWKFARSRFGGGKFCKVYKGSFQESNF